MRTSAWITLPWRTEAPAHQRLRTGAPGSSGQRAINLVDVELATGIDDTPPKVRILEPSGGSLGGIVTIRVEATDDREVKGVKTSDGGLEEVLAPPYTFTWDTLQGCGGPCDGAYSISAEARDRFGNAVRASTTIRVLDSAP